MTLCVWFAQYRGLYHCVWVVLLGTWRTQFAHLNWLLLVTSLAPHNKNQSASWGCLLFVITRSKIYCAEVEKPIVSLGWIFDIHWLLSGLVLSYRIAGRTGSGTGTSVLNCSLKTPTNACLYIQIYSYIATTCFGVTSSPRSSTQRCKTYQRNTKLNVFCTFTCSHSWCMFIF